uniref:Unspecified product n=1 Tax=Theileria annulata TaxID=5874 RepID=A0A3B0MKZ0_THEAN
MGEINNIAPSLIEAAPPQANVANNLLNLANNSPNTSSVPNEVCTLIPGLFGIGIQFVLCIISVLILLLKYYFEFPRRPKKVFFMDFVQLMCGSSTVHLLNIISSILINKIRLGGDGSFVQDECNMYFMTTVFDATIGVYIEYRIVRYLAIKKAASNYLKNNRKSKFTPTSQELADAKKFAINSLNSAHPGLLMGTSSISTTASINPMLEFGKFNHNELGEHNLGVDSREIFMESKRNLGKDLEALDSRRTSANDQFLHDLDDNIGNEGNEDDLLIDDSLPNPSFYSNYFLYNINSLYARFNKWSNKKNNKEFLLNLYTWLIIVSGLKCISIVLFTLFSYQINLVTSYILHPFNDTHRLKLIFVMIVSPLFLNVFQYYVTDSIIKIKIPLS